MPVDVDQARAEGSGGADTVPDLTEWLRFVRAQINSADRVAEAHQPVNGMCACWRPLPCVQLDSLLRRRSEFERAVAALVGPTVALPPITPAVSVAPSRPRRWWQWRRS
jgi:hypothetical protein